VKRSGNQSSPDTSGAVDKPVVTGSGREPGEPVRRRQTLTSGELVEALYHQNARVAELLAGMESVVAGLDDNEFSVDLWALQQACLRFDRDLRARR
jgi:hypothetical protein